MMTAAILLLTAVLTPQEKPVCKDKTGVPWVLPFTEAQTKAREAGRLLLVKAIAFGTTDDGGW